MEPYIFVYVAIASLVPTDRMNLTYGARIASMSIPFLLLLLLTGTRISTGNDWIPYHDYFADLTSLGDKAEDFEIGYRLFAYISKSSGLNYQAFVFLSSCAYLFIFFQVFRKQSAPIVLILLFFCTFLLGWMGTARQVIALALTVLAGQFLLEGFKLRFIFTVVVAGFFHQTAFIFLIAWYLVKPIPKISAALALISICVALGQAGKVMLPLLLDIYSGAPGLGKKIIFYASLGSEDLNQSFSSMLGVLWYIKRLMFLLLFLAFRRSFGTQTLSFYFNAYLVSVMIFLIVNPTFPILATRGANYFAIYELFLLASLISLRTRFSALNLPLLLLVSVQRLYTSLYAYHPELYIPYKGVWINQEVRREAH